METRRKVETTNIRTEGISKLWEGTDVRKLKLGEYTKLDNIILVGRDEEVEENGGGNMENRGVEASKTTLASVRLAIY